MGARGGGCSAACSGCSGCITVVVGGGDGGVGGDDRGEGVCDGGCVTLGVVCSIWWCCACAGLR